MLAPDQRIGQYGEKAYRFIANPINKDARINILSGSVRSSKTWAMHPKILFLSSNGKGVPKGGIKLLTGASKETVYTNVLKDLFDILGPKNYHYNRMTGDLRILNAQWKVMGAKDEGSERYIRGSTIAAAVADELTTMPESFFRQLLNRMSPPGARFYGTTNPDSPFHWLYTGFIANNEINEQGTGTVRTLEFYLDDNPHLSEEYKAFVRNSHSGVFYQRFVLGKWVVAEGVIYRDCWDDVENTFDDDDAPSGLYTNYADRYIPVDYGTANPMVYLEVLDDGDTLWVANEYYFDSAKEKRQQTDEEYVDDLVKFIPDRGKGNDAQILADPSADSFQVAARKRDLVVLHANNDVSEGLRYTAGMFKRRKIKIHRRNCPNLLRERGTYCWDEKARKRGNEEPLKQADHTMDALRYCVKTKVPKWRLMAA